MARTSKLSNVFSILFMRKARKSKRVQRLVDELTSTKSQFCVHNKTMRRFLCSELPKNSDRELPAKRMQAGSLAVMAKVYEFPAC